MQIKSIRPSLLGSNVVVTGSTGRTYSGVLSLNPNYTPNAKGRNAKGQECRLTKYRVGTEDFSVLSTDQGIVVVK